MKTIDNDIRLNGRQLVTLNAALVLLETWSFQSNQAQLGISHIHKRDIEKLSDEFGAFLRNHFQTKGLWPEKGPWTNELIERRSETSAVATLGAKQREIAIAALKASQEEFGEDWQEFLTVAPGSLHLYEVTAADLGELENFLR